MLLTTFSSQTIYNSDLIKQLMDEGFYQPTAADSPPGGNTHSRVWDGKVLCMKHKMNASFLLQILHFTILLKLFVELRCLTDMFLKLQEILDQNRCFGHSVSGTVFYSGNSSDQVLTLDGNRRLVFKSSAASSTHLKVETSHLLQQSQTALSLWGTSKHLTNFTILFQTKGSVPCLLAV